MIFFSLVVGRHLFVRHVLEKLNRHLLLGVGICVPRLCLVHVFVMLADTLLGFFELTPCTFILFLVNAHLFKQLLKDLTLCYIERLVLVRVGTEALSLLALLSFLTLLGRHLFFDCFKI